MPVLTGGVAYRVRQGDFLVAWVNSLVAATGGIRGWARLIYDDGEDDILVFPQTDLTKAQIIIPADHRAKEDGWVVAGELLNEASAGRGTVWCSIRICPDPTDPVHNAFGVVAEGYIYDGKSLAVGHFEDYRDYAQANLYVVLTQANAAGGAVKADIYMPQPATGYNTAEFYVLAGGVTNSGTNGIQVLLRDSNNVGMALFGTIASGAGTVLWMGSDMGAAKKATGDPAGLFRVPVKGSDKLCIEQTAAGAQNDTITITLRLAVRGSLPANLDFSRSTNAANVSVTAGSVGFSSF